MEGKDKKITIPVWSLPFIVTILLTIGGFSAGYAIFTYRINRFEKDLVDEKANNKEKYAFLIFQNGQLNEKILSNISDMKADIRELKTKMNMLIKQESH
jgi:hypothetical protein